MSSPKINVIGLIFQNKQAERYYAKYYSHHSNLSMKGKYNLSIMDGQRKFQKGLVQKVQRMNVISKLKPEQNEIFSFGDFTILLKVINELLIFLICDEQENYFVMESAINCIGKVLQTVIKQQWTGKVIYDQLESIILVTDELIDEGIIVHLDSNVIYERMKMKDASDGTKKVENTSAPVVGGKPASGPSGMGGAFSSIFGFAKNSIQKTLNLG